MSIHRTKSGYRAKWRDGSRQRSKNFRLKVEAVGFLASIRAAQDATPGRTVPSVEQPLDLTFDDFSDYWFRRHSAIHKTKTSQIRDKQTIKDYLKPAFGGRHLHKITEEDASNLQVLLVEERRLSNKSINNITGEARKIFQDAVKWKKLDANPFGGLDLLNVIEPEYKFWTFEERDRFLSSVKTLNKELYDVVAFTVNTGLRKGEVQGLLRDCIDFERNTILVKRSFCHRTNTLNEYTKGKRPRRVPMNDTVRQILLERAAIPMDSPIFTVDLRNIVATKLKPACRAAGVSIISFHELRHTFASHLAMSNVNVLTIKEVMGHTDLKVTLRYMHLAPGYLQGVTDSLVGPSVGGKLLRMAPAFLNQLESNVPDLFPLAEARA